MLVSYLDDVCPLQIGLIAEGAEDRVLFVEEIQDCIELGDFAFIHHEDAVVIRWKGGKDKEKETEPKGYRTNRIQSVGNT